MKYLCVTRTMPPEIHQMRSKYAKFFAGEIFNKFRRRRLCTRFGRRSIGFQYIFREAGNFEVKPLNKLMRDVRCYFNKLCIENPHMFYTETPLIDWIEYEYEF